MAHYDHLPDEKLLQLYAAGPDWDAFEALHRRWDGQLDRYLRKVWIEIAVDRLEVVCKAVWIKTLLKTREFDPKNGSFAVWMMTWAHQAAARAREFDPGHGNFADWMMCWARQTAAQKGDDSK